MFRRASILSGFLMCLLASAAAEDRGDSLGRPLLLAAAIQQPAQTESGEPSHALPSEASTLWNQETLLGHVGNIRTSLDEEGVRFSGTYKSDNLGNLAGGLRQNFAYIHNIDLNITIDGGKALGWTGSTLFAQVYHNNGASFSQYVGDVQVASNIEAGQFTKLYQLWLQQDFLEGNLSLLCGLYDASAEFYATRSSAAFLNSTFGTGKELAQTGANGPSIFPNTALGLRLRATIGGPFVVEAAAIDATPGNADNPYAASFAVAANDGALLLGEIACVVEGGNDSKEPYTKIGIGAWRYTESAPALYRPGYSEDSPLNGSNSGLYLVAERQVSASLAVFVRGGLAPQEMNQVGKNFSAGILVDGPITGRDDDQFGVGLAYAENGRAFRESMDRTGVQTESAEVTVEATYRLAATPWLVLQPDLQYVSNPGTDPGLFDAWVAGLRLEVRL
jgi:porin